MENIFEKMRHTITARNIVKCVGKYSDRKLDVGPHVSAKALYNDWDLL